MERTVPEITSIVTYVNVILNQPLFQENGLEYNGDMSDFNDAYQSVFGEEAYPSVEEKAANLLYFMIKDHPYADGCKRIAASLFLEFLDKNDVLFQDGIKRLSDGTLVAITLMIAESKPEEKDVMVKLVMNLLNL